MLLMGLEKLANAFWRDQLIKRGSSDVILPFNGSQLLSAVGIFKDQAITVYGNHPNELIEGENNKQALLFRLRDRDFCETFGHKLAQNYATFTQTNAFKELAFCTQRDFHNQPLPAPCDHIISAMYPDSLREPGHTDKDPTNWHIPGGAKQHTHFYKPTADAHGLASLTEEDIQCVFNAYRQSAEAVFVINRDGERITPDDVISSEQFDEIIKLYRNQQKTVAELAKKLTQESAVAFIEAFLLTFICKLTERYLLPLIKYHLQPETNLAKISDASLNGLSRILLVLSFAYQFYLGMRTLHNNFFAWVTYASFLTIEYFLPKHDSVRNVISLLNIVISFLNRPEQNYETLANMLGFSVGRFTANNAIYLAENVSSWVIRQLPKLKPEAVDKPRVVNEGIAKATHDQPPTSSTTRHRSTSSRH